jgi:hypothetical protein
MKRSMTYLTHATWGGGISLEDAGSNEFEIKSSDFEKHAKKGNVEFREPNIFLYHMS